MMTPNMVRMDGVKTPLNVPNLLDLAMGNQQDVFRFLINGSSFNQWEIMKYNDFFIEDVDFFLIIDHDFNLYLTICKWIYTRIDLEQNQARYSLSVAQDPNGKYLSLIKIEYSKPYEEIIDHRLLCSISNHCFLSS